MKKVWKQNIGLKAELKEGLKEFSFWLIILFFVIVGVILFTVIFPKSNISGELITYVIFVIVFILVSAASLIMYSRKQNKQQILSFSELCDAIQEFTENLAYIEDGIRLIYQNTSLEIRNSSVEKRCYCTLIREDGTKLLQSFSFDEARQVAIEFLHDEYSGAQVIELSDEDITKIKDGCVYYSDCFDREHSIDLAICASNFSRFSPRSSTCVGERNAVEYSYKFSTTGFDTKIYFEAKHVRNKKKHVFTGNRYTRFRDFDLLLNTMHYTTYDIS